MSSPLTLILWWWLATYASLIAHELGHAIAGWRNGYTVGAIGIGIGRPLFSLRVGGVRLFLGSSRLSVGLTLAIHSQVFARRSEQMALLRGGMFANALLLVVGLAGALIWPEARSPFLILGLVNLLLLWSSLRTKTLANLPCLTDGAQIRALRNDVSVRLPTKPGGPDAAMVELLAGIGYHAFLFIHRFQSVLTLADIGQIERAEAEHAKAHEALHAPSDLAEPYVCLLDGLFEAEKGRLGVAERHIKTAEAGFQATGSARGVVVAQMYRAKLLLRQGRTAEAAPLLSALDQEPVHRELSNVGRLRTEVRLRAAMLSNGSDLDAWLAEAARSSGAAPDADLSMLLAQCHEARGEHATAAGFAEAALKRFETVFLSYPDAEWKRVYLDAKRCDLEAIAEVFRVAGQPERLQDIDSHFAAVDRAAAEALEREGQRAKAAIRRSRLAYGAAAALLSVSFLVGFTALAQDRFGPFEYEMRVAHIGLAFMSVAVGVANLLLIPLWRAMPPAARPLGGWFALASSLMPWLALAHLS